MPYIGRGSDFGVRSRFIYTATAGQTTFSGNDDAGISLAYTDTLYMDVYQNGVLLVPATDYAASTGTSVVLVQGASVDDTVELLVFDIFSVADSVSAKDGGSFAGNVGMGGTLSVTGGIVSPVTINGTTPTLTIGDAGAEDAKIVFDGNAQDFHIGLDDSADSLTIGLGSALGTTSHMVIDSTGAVTMPLQPAFLAKPASLQTNLALNTDVTIVFGTEIFDQNGDFASNTFTAPVTGKYQINVHVYFNALDVDGTFYEIKIITSNRNHVHVIDMRPFDADVPNWSFNASVLTDMDASDTAYIAVKPYNSGAAQADVAVESHFSGYLVA